MLGCSVVGDIFAAPGAQRVLQALQMFKRDAGILLVVLNHSGDLMSANMACKLAAKAGIKVKMLETHDDISAGLQAADDDRRGLAGCIPLYKIVGAAAEEGKSLDELYELGERSIRGLATLAVARINVPIPERRNDYRSALKESWRSVWDSMEKAVADRKLWFLPTIQLRKWWVC